MPGNESQILIRIDSDLKSAFDLVAKSKDRTISQMLRDYIRYEVTQANKTAQGDLFKTKTTPETKEHKKKPENAQKQVQEGKKALLDMFKKR